MVAIVVIVMTRVRARWSEINIWDESEAAPRGLATMQKYPIWSSDRRARREIGREVADKEAQLARALHARADRRRGRRRVRWQRVCEQVEPRRAPEHAGAVGPTRRRLERRRAAVACAAAAVARVVQATAVGTAATAPAAQLRATYAWPWGGGPDRITGTSSSSGSVHAQRARSSSMRHSDQRDRSHDATLDEVCTSHMRG